MVLSAVGRKRHQTADDSIAATLPLRTSAERPYARRMDTNGHTLRRNPDTQTGCVITAQGEMTVAKQGILHGGTTLPGFMLPLADLFASTP